MASYNTAVFWIIPLASLLVGCNGSIMCYQCLHDNTQIPITTTAMTTVNSTNSTNTTATTTASPVEPIVDCLNGTTIPFAICQSGGCGIYTKRYTQTGQVITERTCGCAPPDSSAQDGPWSLDMTCCVADYCNCPTCVNRATTLPPTTQSTTTTEGGKPNEATRTGQRHVVSGLVLSIAFLLNKP